MTVEKIDNELVNIEKEKIDIERRKLHYEEGKLQVEKYKAKWTAIGIIIPIIVAALTIGYGIWGQVQTAKANFAAKAADIAIRGDIPNLYSSKAKAEVLQKLFPQYLSVNFSDKFSFEEAGEKDMLIRENDKNGEDIRLDLVKLLIQNPNDQVEIIKLWWKLYPEDHWYLNRFQNVAHSQANAAETRSRAAD